MAPLAWLASASELQEVYFRDPQLATVASICMFPFYLDGDPRIGLAKRTVHLVSLHLQEAVISARTW